MSVWGSDHGPASRTDSLLPPQRALAQVRDLRLVTVLELCVDTHEHSLGNFGESPGPSTPATVKATSPAHQALCPRDPCVPRGLPYTPLLRDWGLSPGRGPAPCR